MEKQIGQYQSFESSALQKNINIYTYNELKDLFDAHEYNYNLLMQQINNIQQTDVQMYGEDEQGG